MIVECSVPEVFLKNNKIKNTTTQPDKQPLGLTQNSTAQSGHVIWLWKRHSITAQQQEKTVISFGEIGLKMLFFLHYDPFL